MSAIAVIPPDYSVEIKKKYFSHPFSEYSFKLKRNLIIVSFISILINLYDLKITKIPWLNIEVPENAPNLLEGVLALILLYLTIVFIINFLYDIQIWNLNKGKDNFNWTVNKLKEISHSIENISKDKNSKSIEEVIETVNHFGSFIEKTRNKIRITSKWVVTLSMIKLIFLDLALPLLLSSIAIILIGISGFQILEKLF